MPLADLVQEGMIGLVRAVERFDHRRGVKFFDLRGLIRRAVVEALDAARTIRIPPQARRDLGAVQRAERELRRQRPRATTDEAIARRTGLSASRVRTLREAARVTASLDEEVGEDGTSRLDLVTDLDPVDPLQRLDERETRRQHWRMLKLIPQRHRDVLIRRYGIHGEPAQTHVEIVRRAGRGRGAKPPARAGGAAPAARCAGGTARPRERDARDLARGGRTA